MPPGKTLDGFDWGFQPQADRKWLELLGTCEFVRRTENVLFLGPPGVGKSGSYVALDADGKVDLDETANRIVRARELLETVSDRAGDTD